ncbi:MAG: SMP-30/gluconolactonase/LRE family protein [Salinisphaera sp.]|jgi:sugar lactone lactonase YvrE|nr:SMP-30/gluconolactonase/LRE family protein [Salinisphaera sp.]
MTDFECRLPLHMELGESPLWDDRNGALYWVDILNCQLHRLDLARDVHSVALHDEVITCVACHADGGLVAATRSGLWQLDAAGHKQARLADNPENAHDHRFNDGGTDPAGRFWIGTMDETIQTPDGNLYVYEGQSLTLRKPGITISNGLAFSPDGQWLYHTDTPTRVIDRHRFDQMTGEIGPAEPWVELNTLDIEGNPDGAAVDVEGYYWCALFGGAAVARFSPDGELAGHYRLPALNPTMPAFGGTDRRTLFVTTAREHMSETAIAEWPQSGSLFCMSVDTPGSALAPFSPDSGQPGG